MVYELDCTVKYNVLHLQGDSGGPVICERNNIPYLIGISTSVISSKTSKVPQLCKLKTFDGEVRVLFDIDHYCMPFRSKELFEVQVMSQPGTIGHKLFSIQTTN